MTAFPGASIGSPEFANARFADVEFLPANHHPAYAQLVLAVQRMMRDGDNFVLPDVMEAGCWRKTFSLYQKLKDREALEEQRAIQRSQAFRDYERDWNQYIQDRESILAGLRQDVFDMIVLQEHLGLQKDDLGEVLVKERNRDGEYRHPEWKQKASRLASAIRFWHALSAEEKRTLKLMRVARKLEAMQGARK